MAIHLLTYAVEPSESDPDGYDLSACGRDQFDNATTNPAHVTCKRCLKAMQRAQQANTEQSE